MCTLKLDLTLENLSEERVTPRERHPQEVDRGTPASVHPLGGRSGWIKYRPWINRFKVQPFEAQPLLMTSAKFVMVFLILLGPGQPTR
ncbi:hypothetical protein TNIN_283401 [Trichonephila inaurata madagascariensis]|uniref:Uncharacterized protein n=1 Tax=Trichonephila inaurata madagascariensis TaxID=2747483 RepID=A0A8X7CBG7_9ARAC|nr:hypothetical protein TNIN_283401 [Trichonephila inaurata madagascariensis]